MIKITILIPTAYNDKTPVEVGKIAQYLADTIKLAGGCTVDGRVNGSFLMDNGTLQQDNLYKIWVVCEHTLLQPIRAITRRIASDLQQESMYLEWHDVNVEFIKPLEV